MKKRGQISLSASEVLDNPCYKMKEMPALKNSTSINF